MGFLATYCLEQYSSEVYHWDPNGNRGIFHMLLTEVEQVLNGCALTANSDDPHDLQAIMYPSHFAMHRNTTAYPPPPPRPRFLWKDRSVLSKKVEAGAISGASVLEEVVATVSSIISS